MSEFLVVFVLYLLLTPLILWKLFLDYQNSPADSLWKHPACTGICDPRVLHGLLPLGWVNCPSGGMEFSNLPGNLYRCRRSDSDHRWNEFLPLLEKTYRHGSGQPRYQRVICLEQASAIHRLWDPVGWVVDHLV